MTLQRMCLQFATAGFAILMTATGASAYSDEAIKDAQQLLEFTSQRFQAGTAGIADMASARYHLLDMRRRAGKLAQAAFCNAAKRELAIIAPRFEEPNGQAGEKAKWQNEIAAMTKSPAACDGAIATADRLLYGFSEPTNSAADVKAAEDRVSKAQQRFAAGMITSRDLERAQDDLLAAKYGARQISLKAYFDEGLRHLTRIADAVYQESLIGQSNLTDVIGARLGVYRLEATCHTK